MSAEFVMGNVFIREMLFEKAGDFVRGHAHSFDHVTYVPRGGVLVEQLGEAIRFDEHGEATDWEVRRSVEKRATEAHNFVLILAGTLHRLTALEDNTKCHCVYSHRSPQGQVQVEYDGFYKATE